MKNKYYKKDLENGDELFPWAVCFGDKIACLCSSEAWADWISYTLNVCEDDYLPLGKE